MNLQVRLILSNVYSSICFFQRFRGNLLIISTIVDLYPSISYSYALIRLKIDSIYITDSSSLKIVYNTGSEDNLRIVAIQAEGFLNFALLTNKFYSALNPSILQAIVQFVVNIINTYRTQVQKDVVKPITITTYKTAITTNLLDPALQRISTNIRNRYYILHFVLAYTKQTPYTPSLSRPS